MPFYEMNRNEKLRFIFQLRTVLKNLSLCIIRQKIVPPGNSESSLLMPAGRSGGGGRREGGTICIRNRLPSLGLQPSPILSFEF